MSTLRFASLLLLLATAVGCADPDFVRVDATMKSDGYALFSVDSDRERHDVAVTIRDPDPNATYVLIHSEREPTNVGWFRLEAPVSPWACRTVLGPDRCIDDIGAVPGRELIGYGVVIESVKVPAKGASVTLRGQSTHCTAECNGKSYWAVMRVERTDRSTPIQLDVTLESPRGLTLDVVQLQ